jgi:hypothetical protein
LAFTVLRITHVQRTQPLIESKPAVVLLPDLLHSVHPDPYSRSMELSSLSMEQLKELVQGLVDDRIRELIGDPDLGLQLGDSLRARLKQSLVSSDRLSGEDIAERIGLRW